MEKLLTHIKFETLRDYNSVYEIARNFSHFGRCPEDVEEGV